VNPLDSNTDLTPFECQMQVNPVDGRRLGGVFPKHRRL